MLSLHEISRISSSFAALLKKCGDSSIHISCFGNTLSAHESYKQPSLNNLIQKSFSSADGNGAVCFNYNNKTPEFQFRRHTLKNLVSRNPKENIWKQLSKPPKSVFQATPKKVQLKKISKSKTKKADMIQPSKYKI
ncbi:hypothetical protein VP01_4638g1 [Puccinia sorghi]|uniref:Uncharacterized protein n=1 Tax=Puccinia sorghi TaxID=27349 RepID=A0A0L6UND3_9BASI|nr:hypothetical protein VP01_4638g1 [Puccinia sorghi]